MLGSKIHLGLAEVAREVYRSKRFRSLVDGKPTQFTVDRPLDLPLGVLLSCFLMMMPIICLQLRGRLCPLSLAPPG